MNTIDVFLTAARITLLAAAIGAPAFVMATGPDQSQTTIESSQ